MNPPKSTMRVDQEDELERYLRGGSEVSSAYRRASQPLPARAADRRVLDLARAARRAPPRRDVLAYAACALLAVAVLFTIQFAPHAAGGPDDSPRLVRTALPGGAGPGLRLRDAVLGGPDPAASAWLARIAALRRAGREAQADAQYRRFLAAHPGFDGALRRDGQTEQ